MQAQENSRKGCFFVPFLKGDFYGRSNENRRKRNAQSSHARIRSYHRSGFQCGKQPGKRGGKVASALKCPEDTENLDRPIKRYRKTGKRLDGGRDVF